MNDPFSTLGLSTNATVEDAKKAYRNLAKQHHPDLNMGDAAAEAKFKDISAAWEQVQAGWRPGMPLPGETPNAGPSGFSPFANGGFASGPFEFSFKTGHGANPLEDILAAMNAQRSKRNRDYNVVWPISLEDAFAGTEATIPIRAPGENRTITVSIPAGIDNANRIRVPQAGENAFPQFQPGDLYVTVQVNAHPVFTRVGNDLLTTLEADVLDILLGCAIGVKGIDGIKLEARVPAGFDPGNRLRLSGQGMPSMQGEKQRGDLYVSVTPRFGKLNPEQAALVEKARSLR